VEELAQDIDRHLRHLTVRARPSTIAYRAARLVKRHKVEVSSRSSSSSSDLALPRCSLSSDRYDAPLKVLMNSAARVRGIEGQNRLGRSHPRAARGVPPELLR